MFSFNRHEIGGGLKKSSDIEFHHHVNIPGSAYIINDGVTTSNYRERTTKRSNTAKRPVLSRQKPVEKEEPRSPRYRYHGGRRRSSTASDVSASPRRTLSASRTLSMDSRRGRIEEFISTPTDQRKSNGSDSIEKDFKSQLSVCSEPSTVRALSCQSSIEPCVPEESPEQEEKNEIVAQQEHEQEQQQHQQRKPTNTSRPIYDESGSKSDDNTKSTQRPDVLNLGSVSCSVYNSKGNKKFLYRSNSTKSFKKPNRQKQQQQAVNKFKLDEIYFISNKQQTDDDNYNSIEVIDERRRKNFIRLTNQTAPEITSTSTTSKQTGDDAVNVNVVTETEFSGSGNDNDVVKSSDNSNENNAVLTEVMIESGVKNVKEIEEVKEEET